MTTPTIDKTAAEERKRRAAEHLRKLTAERAQLPKRQAEAVAAVERLNQEIAAAERAGSEASGLAALRAERELQRQVAEDLGRCLPTLDREVALAEGELDSSTVACHAEQYNGIVERQTLLIKTISDAVNTLIASITVKEELAAKQQRILAHIYHSGNLSLVNVRSAILGEINRRIEGIGDKTPFPTLDWTCRRVGTCGEWEQRS